VFCGYTAATCVTFTGNRYWTYRHRRSEGQGFARESGTFIVMNVIGIGIQEGLVALATYGLGWKDGFSYNAATVIGIGIATLFRLYAYRTFVFRVSTPASGSVEQLVPETTQY
jgi:putative flippase GtrA